MTDPNDNTDIVNRLHAIMCSNVGCSDLRISMTAKLAANEIQRLRQERDAARQDLCYIEAADRSTGDDAVPYTDSLPKDIAEEWGWDCFKENTNDAN